MVCVAAGLSLVQASFSVQIVTLLVGFIVTAVTSKQQPVYVIVIFDPPPGFVFVNV